jgi:hypothetical protein
MLTRSFILYIQLHVSICIYHHQVVFEYISVVNQLSVKIDLLHSIFIDKSNTANELDKNVEG